MCHTKGPVSAGPFVVGGRLCRRSASDRARSRRASAPQGRRRAKLTPCSPTSPQTPQRRGPRRRHRPLRCAARRGARRRGRGRVVPAAGDCPQTSIADVLDVFARYGASKRFAIVEVIDPAERVVRVAVSGEVAVDLAGAISTRLSGPSGATSFNGEVRGVHSCGSLSGPWRRSRHAAADSARCRAHPRYRDRRSAGAASRRLQPERSKCCTPDRLIFSGRQPASPARREPGARSRPSGRLTRPRAATSRRERSSSPPHPSSSAVARGARPRTRRRPSTCSHPHRTGDLGDHLELQVVDGELLARDLDSTNGTLVLTPAQAPDCCTRDGRRRCAPATCSTSAKISESRSAPASPQIPGADDTDLAGYSM